MFWIHGGVFTVSSSSPPSYDDANLARAHDVVVVGVNHRLNALGFANPSAAGAEQYANSVNVGLLDLAAALGWVQEVVAAFGGDASNVTICENGGGGEVAHLLAMPAPRGLYHRAIIECGA